MATKLTKAQWKRRKRLKRKLIKYGILTGFALILVLILLLIIKVITMIFVKTDDGLLEKVGKITVTQSLLTVNQNSRPGPTYTIEPTMIVIHSTGVAGIGAQDRRDYYESLKDKTGSGAEGSEMASVHFVIGLDGEILQLVPITEATCSTKKYNKEAISIEYCESGADGTMSEATYTSLVTLVAYLCNEKEIKIDGVKLHQELTSMLCPRMFVLDKDAWTEFKANVKLAMNGKSYNITSGTTDTSSIVTEAPAVTTEAPLTTGEEVPGTTGEAGTETTESTTE